MSTNVKYFHSDLAGAPVLSGTAGALIGVLDACLVNGWGSATVDSVVISGGIATVTRGAGHPFEADMVSEIAGATVSGGTINGQRKVLTVVGNTYTFDATGIGNQTATGSITHKVASLGWVKEYSGTNLAAYRAVDPTGSRFYLYVDDTNANNARVIGYETMGSISDTTGAAFPTSAQQSGGLYWAKSGSAGATARPWEVFGDSRTFYLTVRQSSSGTSRGLNGAFGDFIRAGSTDVYASFLAGAGSDQASATPGASSQELDYVSSGTGSLYSPRSSTGLGSSVTMHRAYPTYIVQTSGYRSGDAASNHITYPNPSNGGLYVAPMFGSEVVATALRGAFPGFYPTPQKIGAAVFSTRQKITSVAGLSGRKLMLINSTTGCYAFDLTGPWQ